MQAEATLVDLILLDHHLNNESAIIIGPLDRQLDLQTYLVDISIGCSNPHLALRRIGAPN